MPWLQWEKWAGLSIAVAPWNTHLQSQTVSEAVDRGSLDND